ncbi:unnamed protein product, partial [Rotaria sp. Silwood2]
MLWMLTIIFSISNKTKQMLNNNLLNIRVNSSCTIINSTLFKYESLICENELPLNDLNIKCYKRDDKTFLFLIYEKEEYFEKSKKSKICEHERIHIYL